MIISIVTGAPRASLGVSHVQSGGGAPRRPPPGPSAPHLAHLGGQHLSPCFYKAYRSTPAPTKVTGRATSGPQIHLVWSVRFYLKKKKKKVLINGQCYSQEPHT